jgi:hypothetical protein
MRKLMRTTAGWRRCNDPANASCTEHRWVSTDKGQTVATGKAASEGVTLAIQGRGEGKMFGSCRAAYG